VLAAVLSPSLLGGIAKPTAPPAAKISCSRHRRAGLQPVGSSRLTVIQPLQSRAALGVSWGSWAASSWRANLDCVLLVADLLGVQTDDVMEVGLERHGGHPRGLWMGVALSHLGPLSQIWCNCAATSINSTNPCRASSQWTRRWSKPDSNPRSPVGGVTSPIHPLDGSAPLHAIAERTGFRKPCATRYALFGTIANFQRIDAQGGG
jgi:hypothetical protein